jgi:hypothetical protein
MGESCEIVLCGFPTYPYFPYAAGKRAIGISK